MFSSNASSALVKIFALFFVHVVNSFSLVSHQSLLAAKLLIQSLLNMIHGSRVSLPESSSTSGSVTRACSYSQLPPVLEVLFIPSNVGSTLCNSSALELIFPSACLAVSLSLRVLSTLHWAAMSCLHAKTVLQVSFPLSATSFNAAAARCCCAEPSSRSLQLSSLRCETWHQPRLGASKSSHQISADRMQPP